MSGTNPLLDGSNIKVPDIPITNVPAILQGGLPDGLGGQSSTDLFEVTNPDGSFSGLSRDPQFPGQQPVPANGTAPSGLGGASAAPPLGITGGADQSSPAGSPPAGITGGSNPASGPSALSGSLDAIWEALSRLGLILIGLALIILALAGMIWHAKTTVVPLSALGGTKGTP